MGAWSTRIFDDDGAADIRADYRILLGYGVPNEEAYRKIREKYYPEYRGKDDEDVYWLSIALYQWQNGVLMEEIKENAIRCIDDGRYLEVWKESGKKVYEKRKAVLETLRDKLLNEVNPVKKVGKCPYYCRSKTKWKVGDLLAYRILEDLSGWEQAGNEYINSKLENSLNSDFSKWEQAAREYYAKTAESIKKLEGKFVLLRVVKNGQRPVTELCPELDYMSWSNFMLYDWIGEEIPSEEELGRIPFKSIVAGCERWTEFCKMVSSVSLDCEMRNGKMAETYGTKDGKIAEIRYIGNNPSFQEFTPEMYTKHPGSPAETAVSFKESLIDTFADIQYKKVVWMYQNNPDECWRFLSSQV